MDSGAKPPPKWYFWLGCFLTGLSSLFLLMDAAMKLAKPGFIVQASSEMGFDEETIQPLAVVLLICTALYLIPRTAVLGAVLVTGYLGGAVASHVRAGHAAFQTCFPIIFGVLIWGGLLLRDDRLRRLMPVRR